MRRKTRTPSTAESKICPGPSVAMAPRGAALGVEIEVLFARPKPGEEAPVRLPAGRKHRQLGCGGPRPCA